MLVEEEADVIVVFLYIERLKINTEAKWLRVIVSSSSAELSDGGESLHCETVDGVRFTEEWFLIEWRKWSGLL